MSSNYPNYDAHQLAQLLYEQARIQSDTDAIRSKASNNISLGQRIQGQKNTRLDRELDAEIARLDIESQRSIQRVDNEIIAMIQIEREEMKGRQDREDLIANARQGSDDDGKAEWKFNENGYGGNEDDD